MKLQLILSFPNHTIGLDFEDTEADYVPYGYKSTPFKSAKTKIDDKLKQISDNGGIWNDNDWLPYHTLKSARIVELD